MHNIQHKEVLRSDNGKSIRHIDDSIPLNLSHGEKKEVKNGIAKAWTGLHKLNKIFLSKLNNNNEIQVLEV